ncbi:hypothetical protein AB870_26455 (plasmid) [Pandoraea faecigallinarum]|uniref:Transposase n=1 Tax=Pandoraea faecigallinarum TaxID=656179 RepID=A0A1D8X6R1_9BURK|nr:hypothetical protein AB870_26455 [Pandoraea faecigallinarum]
MPAGIAKVLKRLHYPLEVMCQCVPWYVAYSLSSRDLEEMMAERGATVDGSTIHRWVIKWLPVFEKAIRPEGIVRRNAVLQRNMTAQPVQLRLPP